MRHSLPEAAVVCWVGSVLVLQLAMFCGFLIFGGVARQVVSTVEKRFEWSCDLLQDVNLFYICQVFGICQGCQPGMVCQQLWESDESFCRHCYKAVGGSGPAVQCLMS